MDDEIQQEPWSVESIRSRILARLSERGLSLEDLPSSVRKGMRANGWIKGPTITTLKQTAELLGFTVPELLGAPMIEPSPIDRKALLLALRVAIDAMVPADADCPIRPRPDILADLTQQAYELVLDAARERPDYVYSDAGYFIIASYIRKQWSKVESETS